MQGVEVYPRQNSAWIMAWVNEDVSFPGPDNHTMNADARVMIHYPDTAVMPAMAVSRPGVGSDYGIAFVDADKQAFDGARTCRLRLPPNPPAKDFWALTRCDNQTRSMLQTGQRFPTVGSQAEGLKLNDDGSFDIYFGPKPPQGFERNWLETVPGKGWSWRSGFTGRSRRG